MISQCSGSANPRQHLDMKTTLAMHRGKKSPFHMCIFAWGGALFISTSWRSKKGNKQMSESKGSCQNTKKPHMKLPMLKLTLQTFHANEHFFLISDHCSALFKAYRFAHACIYVFPWQEAAILRILPMKFHRRKWTSEVDKVLSLHGGRPCVNNNAFLALLCKASAFEQDVVSLTTCCCIFTRLFWLKTLKATSNAQQHTARTRAFNFCSGDKGYIASLHINHVTKANNVRHRAALMRESSSGYGQVWL